MPTDLKYISSEVVDKDGCHDVTFTSGGNVLVGSINGVTSLWKPKNVLYDTYKRVVAIVDYKRSLYLVHRSDNEMIAYQVLPDLSSGSKLFNTELSETSRVSVNDSLLVFTDTKIDSKLTLYDFNQNQRTKSISIPELNSVDGVTFTSETTLLASNYLNGKLVHYDLENQKVIWTCEQLKNASCIARDPSTGLIYVFGNGNKVVYVISEQGKLKSIPINHRLSYYDGRKFSYRLYHFCHSPVDFPIRAHSHAYPHSLPRLSALTPAHSRAYLHSLLHVLMHEYRQENGKSRF